MRLFGLFIILGGICAVLVAMLGMDGTVINYGGYGGAGTPDRVANLHGMHLQTMTFFGGWAAMIFGIIVVGFAMILERLDRTGDKATLASQSASSATKVSDEAAGHSDAGKSPSMMLAYGIYAAILIGVVVMVLVRF